MKELKEEGEDSDERNLPLSREGWIMLLSGEINNMKYPDLMKIINPIMLFLIAYIGYMIASVNTVLAPLFYSLYPPLLALFAVICGIIFICWLIDFYRVYKREKALKNVRREIICEELIDFKKIRKQWEEIEQIRHTNKCLFVAFVLIAVVLLYIWLSYL